MLAVVHIVFSQILCRTQDPEVKRGIAVADSLVLPEVREKFDYGLFAMHEAQPCDASLEATESIRACVELQFTVAVSNRLRAQKCNLDFRGLHRKRRAKHNRHMVSDIDDLWRAISWQRKPRVFDLFPHLQTFEADKEYIAFIVNGGNECSDSTFFLSCGHAD